METDVRMRRPPGQVRSEMVAYLSKQPGKTASIPEIRDAVEAKLGPVPPSSIRSGLQHKQQFERVSRGVFRLRLSGS